VKTALMARTRLDGGPPSLTADEVAHSRWRACAGPEVTHQVMLPLADGLPFFESRGPTDGISNTCALKGRPVATDFMEFGQNIPANTDGRRPGMTP